MKGGFFFILKLLCARMRYRTSTHPLLGKHFMLFCETFCRLAGSRLLLSDIYVSSFYHDHEYTLFLAKI